MNTATPQRDLEIYPQTWVLDSPYGEAVGDSGGSTSLAVAQGSWLVEVQPMPTTSMAAGMFWVWLRPRAVLLRAAGTGQSWIAPIGLALIFFYARFFVLAHLGMPQLDRALLQGVAGIFLGWLVTAGFLCGVSQIVGGRPALVPMLTMSAWATLPLTLRSAVQAIYTLATGELVRHPGLAGLLQDRGLDLSPALGVQLGEILLGRLDLYTLWWLGLLVVTVSVGAWLPPRRAATVVGILALLILVVDSVKTLF